MSNTNLEKVQYFSPNKLKGIVQLIYARRNKTLPAYQAYVMRAALSVTCSQCDSPAGVFCKNLRDRKHGKDIATKHPHEQRIAVSGLLSEKPKHEFFDIASYLWDEYLETYEDMHVVYQYINHTKETLHLMRTGEVEGLFIDGLPKEVRDIRSRTRKALREYTRRGL